MAARKPAAEAASTDLDATTSTNETVAEVPAPASVSDVNESVVDPRNDAPGYVDEPELTDNAIIQRRTSTIEGGPQWPADGRYRKVFGVVVPRVSTGKAEKLDWNDSQHDAMHEANKVAVLQEALLRGLHPLGEARFDGQDGDLDGASYGTGTLVYSVEVVPATSEGHEAADTYTPSFALEDQDGTTLPEADAWSDKRD